MGPRARIVVSVLLCATALFAAGAIALQIKARKAPAIGLIKPLPDFELIERSGQPVRLVDLKGKVWLADFIYTTCPGPCRMITSGLADLQNSALQQPDVRL